jgi:hypothetical protein
MKLVDYSQHSPETLLQILADIKPQAAPQNYKNLIAEIERRKEEIDAWKKSCYASPQPPPAPLTAEKRSKIVKSIAALQLICGIWLVIYFAFGNGWISLAIGLVNLACGYLLLQDNKLGFWASAANQGLQIVAFQIAPISYIYNGLGGLYVSYRDQVYGVGVEFNPSFMISTAYEGTPFFMFDFFALAALVFLFKCYQKNDAKL